MNYLAFTFAAVTLFLVSSLETVKATDSDWYRGSALSPDGKTIVFQYKGDIYTVPSKGGMARPLTTHKAWDGSPVWSRDGKSIAFASNRYGNMDVFLMPATGGKAKRLTWHSADDWPTDFTPDSSKILFTSVRQDDPASVMGFTRAGELYEIAVSSGAPEMVLTTPASEATYSADGTKILYRGETGYEDEYRKHDDSSFTRDIWLYDRTAGTHTRLTEEKMSDHTPKWGKGDKSFYFTSDKSGTFNVWKQDIGGSKIQLTTFDTHAVRNLSRAQSGLMAFDYLGKLYTLKEGRKPKEVNITIAVDIPGSEEVTMSAAGMMESAVLSPNGKEIAFVARGDIFVTSVEYATTRRITNTATQERRVVWGKDGKSLLYAAERDGKWRIYESNLTFTGEKYFFAATGTTEKLLIDRPVNDRAASTDKPGHAFKPMPSPDGKKVAFIGDRNTLMVFDRESKAETTVIDPKNTFHYTDFNISFDWSPDSQWLAVEVQNNGRLFFPNIALVKADGSGEMKDISQSGYTDYGPSWHKDGEIITWATARYGRRDHGSHGTYFDIYAQFLTQKAYNKFRASLEDDGLAEEKEKDAAAEAAKEKKKDADATKQDDPKKDKEKKEKKEDPLKIDWTDMDKRGARLTIHSGNISSAVLNHKGTVLYYLMRGANGYDLWSHDLKKRRTSVMVPLGAPYASMQLSKDGKSLMLVAAGRISMINLASKRPKPVPVQASFTLKPDAERMTMFNHIWQQVADKFLKSVKPLHGADWAAMKAAYGPKVASLNNNRDFAEMMSELLGELNASHTGARYRGWSMGGDMTPSLGALFEPDLSAGLKIAHLFPQGPIALTGDTVSAGDTITAINGTALSASVNPWKLLNNSIGKRVRLTIKSGDKDPFDVVIKPAPLGTESAWRYDRWVDRMEQKVSDLSNGRLGYVHLPFMADSTYRKTYSALMGKHFTKEAVVVDSRWNRGGDLTNDLIVLLTGKQYMTNMPDGVKAQGEPLTRWTKPSILLQNEANYSDGHCFAASYKGVGVGTTVGKQVPGTCSYVWWEMLMSGDVVFGVPNLAILGADMTTIMENDYTDPDIRVDNDPAKIAIGQDQQLEKAVATLLQQLDEAK